MAWYSYFFKNFPQLVVIHTVKGFNVVNEAEANFFAGILLLFDLHTDFSRGRSGGLAFPSL